MNMTHKDKLEALLKEFDIEPVIKGNNVILEEGVGNVDGYSGFITQFEFDDNGKFLRVGAWE